MQQGPLGIKEPPSFCQYAEGPCDQDFSTQPALTGLVLYPSKPPAIAETIEAGTSKLAPSLEGEVMTWRELRLCHETDDSLRLADVGRIV